MDCTADTIPTYFSVFSPLEPGGEALYYGPYADVFFPIATSYYDNFILK